MQTTPLAPIGATSIALPLTFAELLDLDEQARAVAACTPWSVEDARDILRARMLYGPGVPWTELLVRGDEAWDWMELLPRMDEARHLVGPGADL
jgi:hypothetical protein